jgi:alpha-galactosidase
VHGVVAADKSRAVYALVQVATSVQSPAGPVRLPGLAPDARYHLATLAPGDVIDGPGQSALPWWSTGLDLPGRVLAGAGVQAPTLYPERLVLLAAVQI